jgi:hypothetical protein
MAIAVMARNVALLIFTAIVLVQFVALELPRWKPWKWMTPWLFPREWRD